ncbi:hypothetical protein DOS70_08535 [Staphylococcus felis]|uniref:Uncharacterized protein n=1 Tax=Staphylococcus felis TaxID=46127 RepID=A0AAQ0HS62_9STAP|nr:hypothetical protein [Staphylococcus felis]AVP36167.1 hypothetical protein C7J90_04090 [Staphylococcus felis]PNZ35759.1 hypothetical protein CD143_05435 [Staphylococcus felis]QQB03863.1 hypothetical protein I6H71_02590 [Staphylococcus felis]REH81048.1 hypothetical protein DOS59_00425 [Staphylococcus felis]REH84942.1 hypothetical protein DOS63_05885 [Staphylococcus felis]
MAFYENLVVLLSAGMILLPITIISLIINEYMKPMEIRSFKATFIMILLLVLCGIGLLLLT